MTMETRQTLALESMAESLKHMAMAMELWAYPQRMVVNHNCADTVIAQEEAYQAFIKSAKGML